MLNCYEINTADLSLVSENSLNYETGEIECKLKEIIKIQAVNGGEIAMIEHKDLLEQWFPKTGCHIFISHSHKDEGIAIAIANKIYEKYGIKSFIDSKFWGFVDKAIEDINIEHSRSSTDKKYLDYDKCMRVASNFYLILSNALTDGIFNSDSFWFLKTDNSFNATDSSSEGTYSPWLFTELNYTSTVALTPHPNRPSLSLESAGLANDSNIIKSASRNLNVRFMPNKSHLTKVSNNSLNHILNPNRIFAKDNNTNIFQNLDHIYNTFDK